MVDPYPINLLWFSAGIWIVSILIALPSALFSYVRVIDGDPTHTFQVCYPFPPEMSPIYPKVRQRNFQAQLLTFTHNCQFINSAKPGLARAWKVKTPPSHSIDGETTWNKLLVRDSWRESKNWSNNFRIFSCFLIPPGVRDDDETACFPFSPRLVSCRVISPHHVEIL